MLSFEGGGHNVGISTSSDGISWGPQSNFGVYSTSTPVVTGAYGNFGAVAFKDSADRPHAYTFTSCAHSSVNVDCFIFLSNFFPPCADDGIPLNGSPGWATDRDVRAYSAANAGGQLNFGNNGGWVQAGTDHSDSGPSVAYNPANGHWYLAWRGAGGGINIRNLNTGATVISADWSPSTPVIAVFQGQLFAAWRGGSNNIVVGRTNLF